VVRVKGHAPQDWPGWQGWLGMGVAVMLGTFGLSILGYAQEGKTEAAGAAVRVDPVVVTATRTETPLSQVDSAITVITAEELEQQQIRIV
jgi:outer membrane cobalamin receptor